jgi:hypothetical protein
MYNRTYENRVSIYYDENHNLYLCSPHPARREQKLTEKLICQDPGDPSCSIPAELEKVKEKGGGGSELIRKTDEDEER